MKFEAICAFVQALTSFSQALQSGQLGPLMNQFGLGEDVANAAAQGGQLPNLGNSLFTSCVQPLKGGRGCLMSPPCLESQGCHLIPLCYLLSCSSA